MAGGDVGAVPLLVVGAAPGATPSVAAWMHKGITWSPEEQIAVMEVYAMVSGDPTTGASQCATEFAVRIERRFLATTLVADRFAGLCPNTQTRKSLSYQRATPQQREISSVQAACGPAYLRCLVLKTGRNAVDCRNLHLEGVTCS
jgi:hypothetical protein